MLNELKRIKFERKKTANTFDAIQHIFDLPLNGKKESSHSQKCPVLPIKMLINLQINTDTMYNHNMAQHIRMAHFVHVACHVAQLQLSSPVT